MLRPCVTFIAALSFAMTASPAASWASVAEELAFHRGVVAFGEGRYDDAKAYFEQVVAAEPNDAGSLQYLGMIAGYEGDRDLSIAYMRRAVAAAPESLDTRAALCAALIGAGRAAEASDALRGLLALDPNDADAHLYLGIAEYRQQHYDATIEQMAIAARLDPSLRLQARYYTGLALTFKGDIPGSAAAFADAAAVSPANPLSQSASALYDRMQDVDRRWALDAMAGVEYDTNPTLIGQPVDPNLERDPDVLGVFTLNGRYNIVEASNLRVSAGYNGYLSLHQKAKSVDQQTHVGWASASWIRGAMVAALRYDFAYTFLDLDRDFRELNRVTPSIAFMQKSWGTSQLLYQFQAFDYKYEFSSELNPDGYLGTLGFNQYFYLREPITYARLGVGWDRSKTDGTEYDFDGVAVNAGLGLALPWSMKLDLLYRYLHRSFRNASVFEPFVKRTDNVQRLAVDFSLPLLRHWELSVRGSFNWNHSNIPVYDYNRYIVGTYARFIF